VIVTNNCVVDGAPAEGTGIRGMRDRAEGVGGRLTAGPSITGWSVEAVLPA
jgi:signal transduction histidine kinase